MMHYSWNAFGKNQEMTIEILRLVQFRIVQQYKIGKDEGFSDIDIERLNKVYKCGKYLSKYCMYNFTVEYGINADKVSRVLYTTSIHYLLTFYTAEHNT